MNKRRIYYLKKCFYGISLSFLSFFAPIPSTYAGVKTLLTQEVTVNLKHVTVKEALQVIEKQSGLSFMYDASKIDLNRVVSLNMTNQKLNLVLEELFQGTDITYEISGNQIVLAPRESLAMKQTISTKKRPFKGVVVDQNGQPVTGANIVIKGTTTGATTGIDGDFTIDVLDTDVLKISFIGYITQEVAVKNKNTLSITLQEDTKALGEVVVVGYGTQKKISVTGAISTVDSKELKTAPSGNLSSMLQGRLPGLITKQSSGQPGSDGASLLVRGFTTLGGNSPLVIVDGIARSFPNVNPDEIESITILKDATSAAVYGVRAANGVILVTTKRGSNQKPTVTFNSSISASTNTNFPKFLNGPDYARYYNLAQELDGVSEENRRFSPSVIDRITNGDPNGIYGNTDWFDLLFKDFAPTYTNNVSLNGGTDRFKYFLSLGSYNQEGIIDRTSYDRYNVRANIDAKVTNNFSVTVNLAAQQSDVKEPGLTTSIGNSYASVFSQALLSHPYLPAYIDGVPVGTDTGENGVNNGVAARDLSGVNNLRNRKFEGNISFKYDIPGVKGLSVKLNAAYDAGYAMKKLDQLPYKLAVFNRNNETYSLRDARHALSGDAVINQWFSDNGNATVQTSVNYSNTFGKHDISGLFLYEYTNEKGSSMSSGKKGFPITDIMDLDYGEEVITDLIKGGHSVFKRAGYVARINYAYDSKYLFEFTGRIDGSPNFPSENRWGFFPGVALGWRISSEDFFRNNVSFVDNLKLKLSAGKLGNDNIGSYAYIQTMSLSKDPTVMFGPDLYRYLNTNGVPNKNITWEKTTSYNVGLEADMWNGLLGVEADVFYMVTKDILQAQAGLYPPSMGGYYPSTLNFGTMDNRGFELTLTHRNRIGDFSYNVRGNISWARNKVIKTTEDANIPSQLRATGNPIGLKYGFVSEGLFQDEDEIANSAIYGETGSTLPGDIKLKDLNGDGVITREQDRTVVGRSNTPEMMFGLNINGEYKGFDFNIFFQGAALCDVALCGVYSDRGGIEDNTFYTKPFYCDGNAPYYLVEGAWTPENRNAKYPRLGITSRTNGGKWSDWWVRDGSYLRLKNLQIGYTIPQVLTQKISIEKVRFYVSGSNLFTLDHLDYLDPEMPDVNQGYYPQQKVFEFGLNLVF